MQMSFELLVAIVMIAFNGCFLDRTVHALDLPIGPWMFYLCQTMLDVVFLTPHVEHVRHISGRWAVSVARWDGKLDAVVGQHGMNRPGFFRRHVFLNQAASADSSCWR